MDLVEGSASQEAGDLASGEALPPGRTLAGVEVDCRGVPTSWAVSVCRRPGTTHSPNTWGPNTLGRHLHRAMLPFRLR